MKILCKSGKNLALELAVMVGCWSLLALGCTTSAVPVEQDSTSAWSDSDSLGFEIIDNVEDDRRFPSECETNDDCNDGDPCTSGQCEGGTRCEFAFKDIDFSEFPHATAHPVVDISWRGSYMYVAEGVHGVEVFNVGNRQNITKVGDIPTAGEALSVVAHNSGYVFVSEGEDGVEIFNGAPDLTLVGAVSPKTGALTGISDVRGMAIGGSYSVVCGFEDGVSVWNSGGWDAPVQVGNVGTVGRAIVAYSARDSYAMLADSLGGVATVIFSGDDGPYLGSVVKTSGRVVDVSQISDTGLAAEWGAGFGVFDMRDELNVERLALMPSLTPVVSASLVGRQTAAVAEESGRITIYDIGKQDEMSEGLVPRALGVIDTGATITKIDTSGGAVVAALGSDGFIILDLDCS